MGMGGACSSIMIGEVSGLGGLRTGEVSARLNSAAIRARLRVDLTTTFIYYSLVKALL